MAEAGSWTERNATDANASALVLLQAAAARAEIGLSPGGAGRARRRRQAATEPRHGLPLRPGISACKGRMAEGKEKPALRPVSSFGGHAGIAAGAGRPAPQASVLTFRT